MYAAIVTLLISGSTSIIQLEDELVPGCCCGTAGKVTRSPDTGGGRARIGRWNWIRLTVLLAGYVGRRVPVVVSGAEGGPVALTDRAEAPVRDGVPGRDRPRAVSSGGHERGTEFAEHPDDRVLGGVVVV